jgi:hypothetical protein
MKMKISKLEMILLVGTYFFVFSNLTFASALTGLQECRAIKNSSKKAECFDKQTQKMLKEENEKKQNEELEKAKQEKAAAEAKLSSEKAAAEAKLASEKAANSALEQKKIENAKKILQVVKRLQTRVETGVSFRDYPNLISDPKFEVQTYLSENNNEIPEFASNIKKAIGYYDGASSIWNLKFRNSSGRFSEITCSSSEEGIINRVIDNEYVSKTANLMCGQGMLIDYAVALAWRKASQSIQEASNVLQKITSDLNKQN